MGRACHGYSTAAEVACGKCSAVSFDRSITTSEPCEVCGALNTDKGIVWLLI